MIDQIHNNHSYYQSSIDSISNSENQRQQAILQTSTLSIKGMDCGSCSSTIERCLQKIEGIQSVNVSLLTERAQIIYNKQLISLGQIVESVNEIGYDATIINSYNFQHDIDHNDNNDSQTITLISSSFNGSNPNIQHNIHQYLLSNYSHCISNVTFEHITKLNSNISNCDASTPLISKASSCHDESSTKNCSLIHLTAVSNKFSIRSIINDLNTHFASLNISLHKLNAKNDYQSQSHQHRQLSKSDIYYKTFVHSLMFTIPIMFITMICPMIAISNSFLSIELYNALTIRILLLWLLATPVQFIVGARFYRNTYKALRAHSANMDVLVALGSSAAYTYSVIISITSLFDKTRTFYGDVFFETSAMLITVVLFGKYIENIAKGKTCDALKALVNLQSKTATLLTFDIQDMNYIMSNSPLNSISKSSSYLIDRMNAIQSEEIDVSSVQIGDILQVLRSSKIPCDGIVVKGSTTTDESMLSGETMPLLKTPGSSVFGATINLDNTIWIRATSSGQDTVLSKIVTLVNDAQTNRVPIQALVDKIARWFVPTVCVLSLIDFVIWYLLLTFEYVPLDWKPPQTTNFLFAFLFSIAVLLISCPCALGLATPTAVMVGTGLGAQMGILFKGGEPIEMTGKTQIVLFDKTGTLTQGKPCVNADACILLNNFDNNNNSDSKLNNIRTDEIWSLIGSAESQSEHLIGRTIYKYVEYLSTQSMHSNVHVYPVSEFIAESGAGVKAHLNNRSVLIGNVRWLTKNNCTVALPIIDQMSIIQRRGDIAVCAAINNQVAAIISITDSIKSEAALVIQALKCQGIRVMMVTGDHSNTAYAVGESIGLRHEDIISQVTPAEKAQVVQLLQNAPSKLPKSSARSPIHASSSHSIVMFVGDGINDSVALSRADIGIAIGSGTEIAIEAASVVLMRNDLRDIVTAISLSKATLNRIQWNLIWASVYNIIAIPIAAGCFYPFARVTLPPIIAAAAMGFSSISVVFNSLLLKRYKKPVFTEINLNI